MDKQIVRLLLDSALECRKAKGFVAQLQNEDAGPDAQRRGISLAERPGSDAIRERVNQIVRSDPAASAAVILKWMNDGK